MSTHDYVIDNQSAPAFRADLNNVLAAIASQNSSGTAPTVTLANMIWYDTANNQIKKRNEANSAWVTLGTIDETAGTFTPSGGRALATQVQAEAGTDNTTLMTPLRSAQAIAALKNVMGTIASQGTGAVGTYAFLGTNFNVTYDLSPNTLYAGTGLRWAGVYGNNQSSGYTANGGLVGYGTWRCMGGVVFGPANEYRLTLFLRVS